MKFTKMQGAGNDFIVINNIEEQLSTEDFSGLAKKLCQRRMAIGADGLMVVEKPVEGGDFKMLFYNADGSLGEMCGNGARCIAKYGFENHLAGQTINIETTAGMVKAWKLDRINYKVRLNDVSRLELNMELEACGQVYSCAYVELGDPGIPHLGLEMKGLRTLTPAQLWTLGSALRCHPALPKGANVNFYEITGEDQVFERTFERGVEDFTYACGTGTGSVVAVLTEKGLCSGKNVKVSMTGGDLLIDVVKDKGRITDLYLSGPAVIVAEGETGEIIG
ncbi:MAG: diaminopimelate epimerase [Emergencia timonensis]|uniref:diaminopimelate epimerase n=1 Tax=Emergencia timonensis TaxID=1776384 RepID=UPI00082A8404|nr:diaminopimelate epimerase [Emergencia timonensis]WNX88755.1 diaminopimelate epimerase [Emergencia timonensis]